MLLGDKKNTTGDNGRIAIFGQSLVVWCSWKLVLPNSLGLKYICTYVYTQL